VQRRVTEKISGLKFEIFEGELVCVGRVVKETGNNIVTGDWWKEGGQGNG
jgi:hypothetical protein